MMTQPLPCTNCSKLGNPPNESVSPSIQSKPPLSQFTAISYGPAICFLGEEVQLHHTPTSFHVVTESNKVPPEPCFLQAKNPQLP